MAKIVRTYTLSDPFTGRVRYVGRTVKEPDYVIARSIGVDKSVIARRRKSLGISSYAASTGNRGCFTRGMPHPRWSRKNEAHFTPAAI